jgi:hypothetical protein
LARFAAAAAGGDVRRGFELTLCARTGVSDRVPPALVAAHELFVLA